MKTYQSTIPEIGLTRRKTDYQSVKITRSQDSADYIRQFYGADLEIYESFFLLLLNRANNTIGYVKISQGGCIDTVVDIKLIAKYCIESLAQSVILCHNHPSGNLQPSEADKQITNKVIQALRLIDVTVLDHIILTENSYYSFADNGQL